MKLLSELPAELLQLVRLRGIEQNGEKETTRRMNEANANVSSMFNFSSSKENTSKWGYDYWYRIDSGEWNEEMLTYARSIVGEIYSSSPQIFN